MKKIFPLMFLILCCSVSSCRIDRPRPESDVATAEPPAHGILLKRGDLKALFKDNAESPQVLSGVQSLFNMREAPGFDAFDPDTPGASAGLNFEHIISGHKNPGNKFTPRHGKYLLERINDHSVRLIRDAGDSPWRVASTMTYTLMEPCYVDFEFRCVPHDANLFGRRGYAVFFFANYMNDVADVALHFRGVGGPGDKETWIAADAPEGHPHHDGGGTYGQRDAPSLEYDSDLTFNLNTWSYEWPRFTRPFYYGRAANNMVFILMFDTGYTGKEEIRFSLFKFKLGRFPRPAWDFQYVVHKVENKVQYGFKGRLVWKTFKSEEDCLQEYLTWMEDLLR